jgi:hypothetical protein
MARPLLRQATNCHTASRNLNKMEIGDIDSAAYLKLQTQRDRALHLIQCFAFNFKQGNFVDFNPEVSALNSAKVVSANTNKRKLNCISPPGISGLQAGSQLIRIQQPIAIDLQAHQHQVQQHQVQQLADAAAAGAAAAGECMDREYRVKSPGAKHTAEFAFTRHGRFRHATEALSLVACPDFLFPLCARRDEEIQQDAWSLVCWIIRRW